VFPNGAGSIPMKLILVTIGSSAALSSATVNGNTFAKSGQSGLVPNVR
jgi:hypothetical protein